MAVDYLVQEEDAVSRFTLETADGFIILETSGIPAPSGEPRQGEILYVQTGRIIQTIPGGID